MVRGSELVTLPESEQGEFYDADSYVVHFSYKDGSGRVQHLVYFWLGRHSSNNEQGTAALLATNMHNEEFNGGWMAVESWRAWDGLFNTVLSMVAGWLEAALMSSDWE